MSRSSQQGECANCFAAPLAQELQFGAWLPAECPACDALDVEARERRHVDAVRHRATKLREAGEGARLVASGVKRQYYEKTFTLRTFDPKKRKDRKKDQLDRERLAIVACEEWVKELHPKHPRTMLDQRGLYIFGPPGLGKSHFAQAALIEAMSRTTYDPKLRRERMVTGVIVAFGNLLAGARDAMFAGGDRGVSEIAYLSSLLDVDAVVLDDIGAIEKPSDFSLRMTYSAIELCMQREKRLILTANYDLEGLRRRITPPTPPGGDPPDPSETNRVLDRILEYCEIVELRGESYR